MSLDHAILGFLDGEPMTGYDLKTRCFDHVAAPFWTADQAQVYRTLERLQRSGFVTSKLHPQPGRPDRKVFAITAGGQRALREWLETPHPLPPLRDPFLLQLFFSGVLPDDAVLALLRTARDGHQQRLERLRREAPSPRTSGRDGALRDMAVRGSISQVRAAIDWIDDCIDRMRAGLPANGDALPTGNV